MLGFFGCLKCLRYAEDQRVQRLIRNKVDRWCWVFFATCGVGVSLGGGFLKEYFCGLRAQLIYEFIRSEKTPRKSTINELKNLMVCWPKNPDYQIGLSQGCQLKVLLSVYVWNQHIVEILWWFSCDVFDIEADLLSLGHLIFLRPNATSCAIYFAVCFLDISCLELHFQPFLNGWKWLNNNFPCKELKSSKWNNHLYRWLFQVPDVLSPRISGT